MTITIMVIMLGNFELRPKSTTESSEDQGENRDKREVADIPGLSQAEMALLALLPEDERELFLAAMAPTTPAPVTTTTMRGIQEELGDIPGLSPEEAAFLAFLPEQDRQMFLAAMAPTTPPPVTPTVLPKEPESVPVDGLSPAEMAILAMLPEDERELFMSAMLPTTPAPATTPAQVTTTDNPGLQEELDDGSAGTDDVPELSPAEMALLASLPEHERELFMSVLLPTTPPPVTDTTNPALQEEVDFINSLLNNSTPLNSVTTEATTEQSTASAEVILSGETLIIQKPDGWIAPVTSEEIESLPENIAATELFEGSEIVFFNFSEDSSTVSLETTAASADLPLVPEKEKGLLLELGSTSVVTPQVLSQDETVSAVIIESTMVTTTPSLAEPTILSDLEYVWIPEDEKVILPTVMESTTLSEEDIFEAIPNGERELLIAEILDQETSSQETADSTETETSQSSLQTPTSSPLRPCSETQKQVQSSTESTPEPTLIKYSDVSIIRKEIQELRELIMSYHSRYTKNCPFLEKYNTSISSNTETIPPNTPSVISSPTTVEQETASKPSHLSDGEFVKKVVSNVVLVPAKVVSLDQVLNSSLHTSEDQGDETEASLDNIDPFRPSEVVDANTGMTPSVEETTHFLIDIVPGGLPVVEEMDQDPSEVWDFSKELASKVVEIPQKMLFGTTSTEDPSTLNIDISSSEKPFDETQEPVVPIITETPGTSSTSSMETRTLSWSEDAGLLLDDHAAPTTTLRPTSSSTVSSSSSSSSSSRVVEPVSVAERVKRGCYTVGGPEREAGCMFPFLFRGRNYTACTAINNRARPWCSTRLDSRGRYIRGRWGYCNDDCVDDPGITPSITVHQSTPGRGKIV